MQLLVSVFVPQAVTSMANLAPHVTQLSSGTVRPVSSALLIATSAKTSQVCAPNALKAMEKTTIWLMVSALAHQDITTLVTNVKLLPLALKAHTCTIICKSVIIVTQLVICVKTSLEIALNARIAASILQDRVVLAHKTQLKLMVFASLTFNARMANIALQTMCVIIALKIVLPVMMKQLSATHVGRVSPWQLMELANNWILIALILTATTNVRTPHTHRRDWLLPSLNQLRKLIGALLVL